MRWLTKILLRFRSLFHRRFADAELDSELDFHLQREIASKISAGMPSAEARRAALREFGGVEELKEECRDTRKISWLQDLVQDLRYGLRILRKSPGFTFIAVATLALGTGASTAIFTLVDRVLLQPLPYQNSNQLIWITEETPSNDSTGVSWPNFQDWKRLNHAFSGMSGYRDARYPVAEEGFSGLVPVRYVAANYFELMGIPPIIGRTFQMSENTPGGPEVAVLSYEYWRERYGSSAEVLGKTVRLAGKRFTVVGVMPAGFGAVTHTAMWLPFEQNVPKLYLTGRDVAWLLFVVGRRRPGASFEQARTDMARVGSVLAKEFPAIDSTSRPVVKDLTRYMVGDNRAVLILLASAVSLLLFITCTNLASLLLVKTSARRREFSIRLALGSAGERVFRQILTEGFLLVSAGGLLGFLTAWIGLRAAVAFLPSSLPLAAPLNVDIRALIFILVITVLASFAIGFAPARFAMKADLQAVLRSAAHQVLGGRKRTQSALVVCEIGLAMTVLVAAGLLARTMHSLLSTNVGFDPNGLVMGSVALPAADYPGTSQQAAFIQQGIERIQQIPGVISAAAVFPVPFTPQIYQVWLAIEGRVPQPGIEQSTYVSVVSAGYFETMRIPIVEGRGFVAADTMPETRSVVIDRGLAEHYWQGKSSIGQSIKLFTENFSDAKQPAYKVVGVAGGVRAGGLDEIPTPRVYVLMTQLSSASTFIARTSSAPQVFERSLPDAIHAISRNVPVFSVGTMQDAIHSSQKPRMQAMWLLIVFSVAALMLAALGLYGVMSYTVRQRTNEIGIRMALGAHPRDICKLVLVYGATLVLGGLAVGTGTALLLGRLMQALLYEVTPADGVTFAIVTVVLMLVAWVACWIPLRRAMKVDPMVALRYE